MCGFVYMYIILSCAASQWLRNKWKQFNNLTNFNESVIKPIPIFHSILGPDFVADELCLRWNRFIYLKLWEKAISLSHYR